LTLGLDRLAAVNLRLMDGSSPGDRFDAQIAALVKARDEGLIDGIGLSNVSMEHLQRAVDQTPIVCVQNLFNLADRRSFDLLDECTSQGIAFVPFCPLGWPRGVQNAILTSPVLVDLGARLDATPAQIALAWLLDLAPNVLLIPGTRTRQHLAENIRSARVRLDDAARGVLARHFPYPDESTA
jgi:pyridoxine 4-dehydrogenase